LLLPSDLREPVWLFPFEGMSVGESFFIPTLRSAEMSYVVNCRAKAAGVRVRCFATIKDDCVGLRVWRID
jgi:hypothetical protein